MTALTCVSCGSEYLVADYPSAVKQGIAVFAEKDGTFTEQGHASVVSVTYSGDEEAYDDAAGENEAYRCGDCYATARSVEALVGMDPDGRYERGAILTMIGRLHRDVAELARELASLPAGAPLGPESEVTAAQAQASREACPVCGQPDNCGECKLPSGAVRIVRAGVTIDKLQAEVGYDPEGDTGVDSLIAYKDALEDAHAMILAKRTLDVAGAAYILFGDRLDADDFDPVHDSWQSGADIAEALAAHFQIADSDYRRVAAERRR